jgi:hypothetical protein
VKRSKFTEAQIASILRQAEEGTTVAASRTPSQNPPAPLNRETAVSFVVARSVRGRI